jgi:hypothetical protein
MSRKMNTTEQGQYAELKRTALPLLGKNSSLKLMKSTIIKLCI